jgi:hypothetical protein
MPPSTSSDAMACWPVETNARSARIAAEQRRLCFGIERPQPPTPREFASFSGSILRSKREVSTPCAWVAVGGTDRQRVSVSHSLICRVRTRKSLDFESRRGNCAGILASTRAASEAFPPDGNRETSRVNTEFGEGSRESKRPAPCSRIEPGSGDPITRLREFQPARRSFKLHFRDHRQVPF